MKIFVTLLLLITNIQAYEKNISLGIIGSHSLQEDKALGIDLSNHITFNNGLYCGFGIETLAYTGFKNHRIEKHRSYIGHSGFNIQEDIIFSEKLKFSNTLSFKIGSKINDSHIFYGILSATIRTVKVAGMIDSSTTVLNIRSKRSISANFKQNVHYKTYGVGIGWDHQIKEKIWGTVNITYTKMPEVKVFTDITYRPRNATMIGYKISYRF